MHMEEYDEAIRKCIEKGAFILQDELEEFEENLAKFLGMKYAVGVGNGTDALFLAMKASGHRFEGTTTTTSYTFKATMEAIHHQRWDTVVKYIDIDPETRMPDERVDVAVHIEGMVCDKYKFPLIEDAAQAIGAKGVGYSGTACYSFYPAKILGGLGDGGAVVTDSKEVADKVRLLRHHWQTNENEEYGYNSRLDNIQAAFLNVKLKYLPEILKRREEIAEKYKALKTVGLPIYQEGRVWQDYVVTHPESKKFCDYLKDHGIQTLGQGMTPPHKAMGTMYEFPNTEKLYKEMFRLPCNETLTDEDIDFVIETVNAF